MCGNRKIPQPTVRAGSVIIDGAKACEFASAKSWYAKPICFKLFPQETRLNASRTFCTAGTSRLMRTAMMAITTRSSIKVKACRHLGEDGMSVPRSWGRDGTCPRLGRFLLENQQGDAGPLGRGELGGAILA